MIDYVKQNRVMIIITSFLLLIAILFLVIVTPIINHHIEVTKIKNQIEEVQLKIELNKEQWNTCFTNMETWHTENEQNRQILNDLMQQYNDMVGFTMA
jgi:predicted PurR-regulated permease PerM